MKLEPYLVRFRAHSVKLWGFKVAAGANSAAGSGAAQKTLQPLLLKTPTISICKCFQMVLTVFIPI
jgi:hypothetical protein